MDKDNQTMTETTEEESFEKLLEQSFVDTDRLEPGQKVEAVILKITSEWIFLDLGRKSEGYLARQELLDEEGNLTVKEGDTIEAYFLFSDNNGQLFTTKIGAGEAGRDHLEQAWQSGIPVEGLVEKEIKGGFEVKIAGNTRAFCPHSQMGLQRIENPSQCVGQRLSFKIGEYREKGRNIILSNRAFLEEERQKHKEILKASLQEGMTVKGTVTSIRGFGAFVNIGGIEGLVPISEIGWGRVEDIHELLSLGQEVEVVVMSLDWENDRFSFSLKEALPNPWEDIEEKYPEGSHHTGEVVSLKNFGAFVTLEKGVDGLIHVSRLGEGRRIHHPREIVTEGQEIEVKIETIDKENKRLSLSLAKTIQEKEQEDKREDYRRYVEAAPKSMGTLGDLLKTKLAEKTKK
jgi:small subunit ribosomal protein S1